MSARVVATAIVPEEGTTLRFDAWCAENLPVLPSRSAVRKAIKRGEVLLNGEIAESSRFLVAGDTVKLMEDSRSTAKVYPSDLEVLFEDDHIAVVYKPAGLRVNGSQWRTLENTLPFNLKASTCADRLRTPRVAHRLDQPTQGVVLCAKTGSALKELGHAFEERRVQKTYGALLLGRLDGDGVCELPIEERDARSEYSVISSSRCMKSPDEWITTVRMHPVTGRQHQLRIHMASLGHPVIGDVQYTPEELPVLTGKGLYLASLRLAFNHPITGEPLDVGADEPHKFESMRSREARRWLKYNEDT